MRHVGILAHSVPGAALCFRAFGERGMQRLGDHHHPDVSMDCIAMGRSMPAWEAGDHASIRALLATSVERLARTGADFFICPDNTAHIALESPGPDLALPGLHIAEVVAAQAAASGYQNVGILGTRWTMESDLYPRAFAARGIHSQIPDEDARATIQDLTFKELTNGIFTDDTRRRFTDIISGLAEKGCDAVALVCTEFPILLPRDTSPLPTLESTVQLAHPAADVAIDEAAELPVWRGPITA